MSKANLPPPTGARRLGAYADLGVTLLLLGALIVVLAADVWLATVWLSQPYLGVQLDADGVVVSAYALSPSDGQAGLRAGDRLLSTAGSALPVGAWPDANPIGSALAGAQIGQPVEVVFERPLGEQPSSIPANCTAGDSALRCTTTIQLGRYPIVDFIVRFALGWLVGAAALAVAVVVLRRYRGHALIKQAALFMALFAPIPAGVFDLDTTRALNPVVLPVVLLSLAAMLVHFALSFPAALTVVRRRPLLQLTAPLVLAISLGGLIYAYTIRSAALQDLLLWSAGLVVLGGAVFFASLVYRIATTISPRVRDQSAITVAGMLLALVPVLVWLFSASARLGGTGQASGFSFVFAAPFVLLVPVSMLYALSQDVLPESDRVVSRTLVFSGLALAITLGYGLLVTGAALITGSVVQFTNPLAVALVVFLVALAFVPMRNSLEKRVDSAYFRTRRLYQDHVEGLAQELTQVSSLGGVVDRLRVHLDETLQPAHSFLFFPDDDLRQYVAYGIPNPETDIRFDLNSPLARVLRRSSQPLVLDYETVLPPELVGERSRLAVLGAPVIIPLPGRDRLAGILMLGQRRMMARYHHDDLAFVQALADQVALSVERAQVIANLEQRVREMNVLGQVAQAVNFTADFDDLLELIYAQTNRVIHAPNFYIALRDPNTEELYYAFYSENDERLQEREGVRWRIGRDLLSDIVRSGQPVRVDHYAAELAARGVESPLENTNLRAWMGVPLAAPGSALGAMSVASTEVGASYSDEQLKILWQIADQAAIAIEKARLFRETEIRAHQLTALNEISVQLATVFQDNDRLLELITESAMQILEGEAGSLLLVNPETHELEFKVVLGSQANHLVGLRIPPGTGLVGAVADRGEPIIINDANRDPRWFSGLDKESDFNTETLIAAPLHGNSGVIGVLEVINKRDGGVFVEDDKRLLLAYAGQAAIAIENARLFQMTDEQLAARVEELDTMQKIDRELNETLKLQRVLNITLDWALRESGATAGALGMVVNDPPGLQIMVHYGYPPNHFDTQALWPLDEGLIGRVVRSRQPELVSDVAFDVGHVTTLPDAKCQLAVPLFTGGEVSGVIILESQEAHAFSLLDLDFMSRLAEHASPAMANASLLAQLEQANDSRSEFVGFVAHELKTPMTSIRGFTDLLLGGVVGPLNEQQKNFLATIRANVDRMNTLVSDLNDVTKLQTDRMQMEMAVIDFHDVVTATLAPLQNQIAEKGQQVHVHVPRSLPRIYADQNRLVQVLTNLLTNAHKYTPPDGEITIIAAPEHGEDSGASAEMLHVAVSDTGIGISAEDVDRLFTPYFRTDNPAAREQPGTGLGLVIVRGIVEQHGGEIWVESEPGAGSTFHVTLPLASTVSERGEMMA